MSEPARTTNVELGKYLRQAACIVMLLMAASNAFVAQSTNPVIVIPGITGSELVNKNTGKTVWFRISKSKTDDLRLPILADISRMHDSLVPTDILRGVKIGILPRYDVYGGLIDALVTRGGYHEESWDAGGGSDKAIYVFAYDWRLDNVSNARLLVRKVESLKRRLKKPGLKFDVIAHSMGGLIARYAAMYGDADLAPPGRKPQPTWAGARNFDNLILMGTPNEGSALSLNSLINGLRLGGLKIDLPFVRNMTKFDVFTIPSAFELLPAPGTLKVFDERLEPLNVDIFDSKDWAKYGWDPFNDKGYEKAFSPAERRIAHAYFTTVLSRAKRLFEALAVGPREGKSGVSIHLVGSDCKDALDSIVIYKEKGSDKWKTLFRPSGFTTASGEKVTSEELKKVMIGPGDGTVTKRSLEATTEAAINKVISIFFPRSNKFVCEEHDRLQTNTEIQDYLISLLTGKTPEADPKKGSPDKAVVKTAETPLPGAKPSVTPSPTPKPVQE